jgi:hypothetical protein
MTKLPVLAVLLLLPGWALAQDGGHGPLSPYSGQETRAIKNLSEADITELRRGGGWGLAKAAELNGVPGPAHLLELKDDIPLSADQIAAVQAIFERMRKEAIEEGERLIAGERALDEAFRARTVTEDSLRRMLADIERSRSALRYIHLSAHLDTIAIVAEQQVARYNTLRGYGSSPCANVPAGHDPAMWRKHNGCQ